MKEIAYQAMVGTAPPTAPRMLMLKSPMMTGDDVRAVQRALNQRNQAGLTTDGTTAR
jgi:peptidoglycan hydrolase-like protein with peptidoglycan-binding domain